MAKTLVSSFSIKARHVGLYEKMMGLKPAHQSFSDFFFTLLNDCLRMKENGVIDFNQDESSWVEYLNKCTAEEYRDFYEKLDKLNKLERIITGKRLTSTHV